ncbi:hypothetical protein BDV95DRAFT_286088 [Massariosphaeria phaeospora]|uniref:F-box domain-containing protein n=1 Tax=Massariosphaeria phaeospora TaxID=100035 RepID=A0A7C8MKX8_9PLEO|nr:hypothetical protein BDV95DRAFT_286088 [Massariosphaeria phaeospora]
MLNNKDFPPLPSDKDSQNHRTTHQAQKLEVPKRHPNATMDDLPDELILRILEYLPFPDVDDPYQSIDNSQLTNLALGQLSATNRRLHNIVSEQLYASFRSSVCAPYLFLRTMISNRHAAHQVRSISFKYGPYACCRGGRYVPSIADRKVVKEGLKALEIPGWKDWATDCNDQVAEEMLYASILMHTPNVTSLTIDDGTVPYKIPKWLELVRRAVSRTPFGRVHWFPNLQTIEIDVGPLKLRHLAPLFRLPSLRKLQLDGLVELGVNGKEDLPGVIPHSSPIEELLLPGCLLQTKVLGKMLLSCRRLKTFEHEYSDTKYVYQGSGEQYWRASNSVEDENEDENEHEARPLDFDTLATYLQYHSKSLNTLILSREMKDHPSFFYTPEALRTLGDLQSFPALTHLVIELRLLLDVNAKRPKKLSEHLPLALKTISFYMGGDDRKRGWMALLEEMIASHGTSFLSLEEFTLFCRAPWRRDYDWEQLRKRFLDVGVTFHKIVDVDTDTDSDSDIDDTDSDEWD